MKTRLSLHLRRGLTRRTRIAVIVLAAMLPLTLVAQQAQQASPATARSPTALLPAGTATPIPFSGEGWQDKVLTKDEEDILIKLRKALGISYSEAEGMRDKGADIQAEVAA